jgi:hypothetical protein
MTKDFALNFDGIFGLFPKCKIEILERKFYAPKGIFIHYAYQKLLNIK